MSYTAFHAAYREVMRQGYPHNAKLADVVEVLRKVISKAVNVEKP